MGEAGVTEVEQFSESALGCLLTEVFARLERIEAALAAQPAPSGAAAGSAGE